RLLRLFGHGSGAGIDVRLQVAGKFQLPVHLAVDERILAALAHFAVQLVSRLSLHSTWWQSLSGLARVFEPGHGVFPVRLVARRQLAVCRLGTLSWRVPWC